MHFEFQQCFIQDATSEARVESLLPTSWCYSRNLEFSLGLIALPMGAVGHVYCHY